jgi:hypothetical protein
MAAWDRIAAAVTHRRSWVIAMLIAAGAGVVIVLAGANTGADKAPLQLPAESARAAALLELFPGGGEMPAILVVSRRDGALPRGTDRCRRSPPRSTYRGRPRRACHQVALVFVLLVLPPLLGLFGRRLFPSGLTDPIQVIGATGRAAEIQSAITTTPGVVSASNAGSSASGLTQRKVVLDAPHGSTKAFKTVCRAA